MTKIVISKITRLRFSAKNSTSRGNRVADCGVVADSAAAAAAAESGGGIGADAGVGALTAGEGAGAAGDSGWSGVGVPLFTAVEY